MQHLKPQLCPRGDTIPVVLFQQPEQPSVNVPATEEGLDELLL